VDETLPRAHTPPPAGLCDGCAHQRIVRNTRGSMFSLCELSRVDPAYPRYPRVPVLECAGFRERSGERRTPPTPPAE